MIFRFGIQHRRGNDGLNDVRVNRFAKFFVRNLVVVLRRNHHRFNACWSAVTILNGDLRFSIRPQEINLLLLANVRQPLRQTVRQLDRHGHQLFRLVARKSKHQTLVARAAGVHSHGDVWRLPFHRAQHGAGLAIVSILRAVVAHASDGLPHQLVIIHVRAGGNLSRNHRQTSRNQRLAGHPTHGVLSHHFIQHRVRNLVRDFIRVTFRHGFRCKQKIA